MIFKLASSKYTKLNDTFEMHSAENRANQERVKVPASVAIYWHRGNDGASPVPYLDAKSKLTWDIPLACWKPAVIPCPSPIQPEEMPHFDPDHEVEWEQDIDGNSVARDLLCVTRLINANALNLFHLNKWTA